MKKISILLLVMFSSVQFFGCDSDSKASDFGALSISSLTYFDFDGDITNFDNYENFDGYTELGEFADLYLASETAIPASGDYQFTAEYAVGAADLQFGYLDGNIQYWYQSVSGVLTVSGMNVSFSNAVFQKFTANIQTGDFSSEQITTSGSFKLVYP